MHIHAELLPAKHQRLPPRVDPVEALLKLDEDTLRRLLKLDEDTLRRLLGVPKMTNDGLHNDDDDEEVAGLD